MYESECVQILFKMQVNGVGVLERVVAHLTRTEESVTLWTQTNKLLHRHRIQFVLEECDCLAIHSAIEWMVEGVLTEIIVSCSILCHNSIDIFCLNSIAQTIHVREQQLQLITTWVFCAHVIVERVVHVQL